LRLQAAQLRQAAARRKRCIGARIAGTQQIVRKAQYYVRQRKLRCNTAACSDYAIQQQTARKLLQVAQ
jgi:hypothetical protein